MSKQILIDSHFGLVRTAIADGRALLDYYEESPDQGRTKGNIYRGVVKKVDAPIQAAFVRFGNGRDGFLALRDAGSGNKAPKVGDSVLVQVIKDEVGEKGAALTTKLSLSGRYLVFIPERESEGGISSRITDEERSALKKALEDLKVPDGGSIILRTAAMNKGADELQADLDRLTESYREITEKFAKGNDPALLFREVPPALRYLREYYAPDVERIWVNQEDVLDQCRQFFYLYEPKSAAKVTLSQDGPLMFQKLGLEADVERLTARKVSLPSGANIIIDQAEALVAIDVNSAKAGGRGEDGRKRGSKDGEKEKGGRKGRGHDLEETVFAVNKEAAVEIARQLRLRDLGGIIIVDFIDMEEEKHRRHVEEAMRRALAPDKAKVKVYDISPLGIMEISRQRLRKAGPNFSRQACEPCQGRGWHPSPAAGALTLLRKVEERLHGKKAGQSLMVSAPYPVANKLMNEFREHVFGMEKRFGATLRVSATASASGEAVITAQGAEAAPRGEAQHEHPRPEGAQEARGGREGQRQRGGREERGQGRNANRQPGAQDARGGRDRDGRNAVPVESHSDANPHSHADAGIEAQSQEAGDPVAQTDGAPVETHADDARGENGRRHGRQDNRNVRQEGSQAPRRDERQDGRRNGRQDGRHGGRQDGRQAVRQDPQQDGRQEVRQDAQQGGRQGGRQDGHQADRQDGRQDGQQVERQDGRQDGQQAERQDGRQDGQQADRQDGRQDGQQEGRQDGRREGRRNRRGRGGRGRDRDDCRPQGMDPSGDAPHQGGQRPAHADPRNAQSQGRQSPPQADSASPDLERNRDPFRDGPRIHAGLIEAFDALPAESRESREPTRAPLEPSARPDGVFVSTPAPPAAADATRPSDAADPGSATAPRGRGRDSGTGRKGPAAAASADAKPKDAKAPPRDRSDVRPKAAGAPVKAPRNAEKAAPVKAKAAAPAKPAPASRGKATTVKVAVVKTGAARERVAPEAKAVAAGGGGRATPRAKGAKPR